MTCQISFTPFISSPWVTSNSLLFLQWYFSMFCTCYFLVKDDFSLLVICYYPFRSNISSIFSNCAGLEEGRWGQQNLSSCPSNVVLLGPCGPVGCFSFTPRFGDFHMVSYLWRVASWSSYEGDWSWERPLLLSWWHHLNLDSFSMSLLPRTLHQKPVK